MDVDEAALLKLYGLSTLEPHRWEEAPVEEEDTALELMEVGEGPGGVGSPQMGRKEIDDPLGLRRKLEIPKEMDIKTLAPTLLSSKQFSPSTFLSLHHPDATYQDLQRGVGYLKENVERRGEEVRVLVEREFGRFVSVKGSGDAVFKDMQYEFLAEGTDHGTREVREIVKVTSHKAETIFLPLLSNALKAQKLRSTLSVFERSKFLFGLPRTLRLHVKAGKYDLALRDYNKGLYLLNSKKSDQLLPLPSTGFRRDSNTPVSPIDGPDTEENSGLTEAQTQARKEQQQRVFEKIRREVDKAMNEMQAVLQDELREGNGGVMDRSMEDVEKRIEMLLELNPKDDPAWLYMDVQHDYITAKLKAVYNVQVKNYESVKRESMKHRLTDKERSVNLLTCVERLSIDGSEGMISKSAGFAVWESIVEVVHGISQVLEDHLPAYWRICKGYIDGKYKRRDNVTSSSKTRSPAQCRSMTIDIIKLYISLIGQFFTLSDVSIAAAKKHQSEGPPAFVPEESNSITTCHFVSRLLTEIVERVGEVDAVASAVNEGEKGQVGSSSDIRNTLKGLVESCRWRFEEAICETWAKDAKMFFPLEIWAIDTEVKTTTTIYLQHIRSLQRHNATIAWQVAGGAKEQTPDKANVPEVFVNKIKNCFFDTLYYLLDGLVHIAFSEPEETAQTERVVGEFSIPFDVQDRDHRVLVTISNLSYLKAVMLPKMLQRLEAMYGLSIKSDRSTLDEVFQQLDDVLNDDLIKRKTTPIAQVVEQGLLGNGIEWAEGGKPTEVRPYMFKALLHLVEAHSQVNSITPSLVKGVLEKLTEELARSMLESFKKIPRLAIGGMLSATLEVEFLHQTLLEYMTPDATAALNSIYATISHAYTRKSSGDNLQQELEDLKRILFDSRRATGVQFVCFKETK